jgi:hypothetical protein
MTDYLFRLYCAQYPSPFRKINANLKTMRFSSDDTFDRKYKSTSKVHRLFRIILNTMHIRICKFKKQKTEISKELSRI